jgi:ABC-type nitrate/sulfonate/bicarbonate transport system permease component
LPRKELLRGCISILVGLVIWEILTRLLLENELLIPPPTSVIRSFWNLTFSGQLNKHFAATLIEFSYGFTTACIAGIVIESQGRRLSRQENSVCRRLCQPDPNKHKQME